MKNGDYVGVDEKYIPEDEKYIQASVADEIKGDITNVYNNLKTPENKKKIKKAAKTGIVAYITYISLILIVIVVIFILSFKIFNGVLGNINGTSNKSFNFDLEFYSGEQEGIDAKSLLDEVIKVNKTDKKHKISVIYENENTTDPSTITTIKQSFSEWDKYEISQDYDNNGYINKITITKLNE